MRRLASCFSSNKAPPPTLSFNESSLKLRRDEKDSNTINRAFVLNKERRSTKINFEFTQPAEQLFRADRLPSQVTDLLVYLAREAIAVPDLFRRSGSAQDIKRILRQLKDGSKVIWTDYSFYTLANVAKRFLLSVEGGILGHKAEEQLIDALSLPAKEDTLEAMHRVIMSLSLVVQSLLVLLFGTWFRMMYHTEINAMCLEGVAKSVAGSVFLNSCSDLHRVEYASLAMQFLIENFPSSSLFGPQLLHYFAQQTKTSILGIERFQYTLQYSTNVPKEKCIREFVKMLKIESDRHGFDLLGDLTTKEKFEEAGKNANLDIGSLTMKGNSRTTSPMLRDRRNSLVTDKRSSIIVETEHRVISMLDSSDEHKSVLLNETQRLSSTMSEPGGGGGGDGVDSHDIRLSRMERLKQRSHWFLKSESSTDDNQVNFESILSNSNSTTLSNLPTELTSFTQIIANDTNQINHQHHHSSSQMCAQSSDENHQQDHLCKSSPTKNLPPGIKEEVVYFVVKRIYGPI